MPVTKEYRAETMALLNQVTEVTDRAMFGGVGLYNEGLFFALMDNDKLYFKVGDTNRCDYEAAGMGPFYPFGDESMVMQYYQVPDIVLDDPQTLRDWIGKSVEVAKAKKKGKKEVSAMHKAMFGAGCFWGVEAAFRQTPGVVKTSVGYSGGNFPNPTYKDVCSGRTGHAEVVLVEFDPEKINYEQILQVFWDNHDPTTLNRQGPDVGTQYRSAIYYYDEEQKTAAETSKSELDQEGRYRRPIVTEIKPAGEFYMAEDYHQQYLEKRGLASCHL